MSAEGLTLNPAGAGDTQRTLLERWFSIIDRLERGESCARCSSVTRNVAARFPELFPGRLRSLQSTPCARCSGGRRGSGARAAACRARTSGTPSRRRSAQRTVCSCQWKLLPLSLIQRSPQEVTGEISAGCLPSRHGAAACHARGPGTPSRRRSALHTSSRQLIFCVTAQSTAPLPHRKGLPHKPSGLQAVHTCEPDCAVEDQIPVGSSAPCRCVLLGQRRTFFLTSTIRV